MLKLELLKHIQDRTQHSGSFVIGVDAASYMELQQLHCELHDVTTDSCADGVHIVHPDPHDYQAAS